MTRRPRLSVIVPFHRNLEHLRGCLEGLAERPPDCEVIVVADAAIESPHAVASRCGACVIDIPGPVGPARARNIGARAASGDFLVFVDADVVVEPGTLQRLVDSFRASPEVVATFGAYDDHPPEPNLVSQYKNLTHSYIHRSSAREAHTFWAGFGSVRRDVFLSVGGFDERFRRPSVEDIELGYRLTSAGYRVLLDPTLRVTHLKRWTLRRLIVSDIFDRGIPWTQLILRAHRAHYDLNLRSSYRVCVVLAYLAPLWLAASVRTSPLFLLAAAGTLGLLGFLSRRFYRYFIEVRGGWFAVRVIPLHYLYHLYNGISFAVGSTLYCTNRILGVRLPGALPLTTWRGPLEATLVLTRAAARHVEGGTDSVSGPTETTETAR